MFHITTPHLNVAEGFPQHGVKISDESVSVNHLCKKNVTTNFEKFNFI